MNPPILSTNACASPRVSWRGSPRVPVAFGAVLCGIVAFAWWSQTPRTTSNAGSDVLARSSGPLRIRPLVEPLLGVSPEDWEWIRRQIQPLERGPLPVSYGLHLLRVHGREGKFSDPAFASGDAIIKLLTDQKASTDYFGHPALIRTRHGIRFPTNPFDPSRPLEGANENEFHRDQCLSAFGELGIPLSFPLAVDGQAYELREVLRDSIANFFLAQRELNWTALAYILYLPPEKTWVNRYGERFSFDDLTEELLRRPLDQAACAGTHLTLALTMLERADELTPILTETIRVRLRQRLRRDVEAAVRNQQADGHWSFSWHAELVQQGPDEDPIDARVLASGHVMEWTMYLPTTLGVPVETKRRGAMWLYKQLRKATTGQKEGAFCPYSHASIVLRAMAYPVAPRVQVARGLEPGGPGKEGATSSQTGAERTDGQRGRGGSAPGTVPSRR
jgi:hypothetical protein